MEQLAPELLSRLDALALKLGTTVEYLWAVLVKQTYFYPIQWLIAALVLLVCGSYVRKLVGKGLGEAKKERGYKCDLDGWYVAYYFGCVVLGAGVLLLGIALYTTVVVMVNPEYYALTELLRLIVK